MLCFQQIEGGSLRIVPRKEMLIKALTVMSVRIEMSAHSADVDDKKTFNWLISLQSAPGVGKSYALWLIASLGQLTDADLDDLIRFGMRHKLFPTSEKPKELKRKFSKIINSAGLTVSFNFGLECVPEENRVNSDEFLGWRLLFR